MVQSPMVQHTVTQQRIDSFLAQPAQTLLISGPAGIGKSSISRQIAAELLQLSREKLAQYPYITIIDDTAPSISIDAIRELQQLLTRKLPGTSRRVIIIEAADRLGEEAQNALLKSLEEPPERTTWLLTAHAVQSLLPTVRSRITDLVVIRPTAAQLEKYFVDKGYAIKNVQQAHLMSGGLPGLMQALLDDDAGHPLLAASTIARQIVQADRFQRLAMVDTLAKDKLQTIAALDVLQAMAHVSIAQDRQPERWQKITREAYAAGISLRQNAQPKLVLTNFMLHL